MFQLIFCHERIDCGLSLKKLDYPLFYLGPLVLHQEFCSLSKISFFSQNKTKHLNFKLFRSKTHYYYSVHNFFYAT
jgi:hypothetical protein